MSARLDRPVRFGVFELDLNTGELRKAGAKINLPEQPFQVLEALLDRPGDLVTREELRQRLWPAETFVDFDQGLNAAVRRLRDALGDSADTPRFVETLPRRGYRFIAPVAAPSVPETQVPPHTAIEDDQRGWQAPDQTRASRRLTRTSTAVAVAAVALVSAVILWTAGYLRWPLATARHSAPLGRFMLAVLPFENLTGNPDQAYVSDGMTEELITQLSRMDPSHLGVIARTSAMQFKKTTKRAGGIGSELGVSHLIEGSVRTTGSRIRIAVQLIETQSETHLWAEHYERDAKDLLTLQREVAEAITRQISSSLGIARSNVTADGRRHSTIAEAYEHYLRGRYHWAKDNREGLEKAKEHFLRAFELDSSYALAYSGLADTYASLGSYGFWPMNQAYPLGRDAAQKALELDDMLAEAHLSMAQISADYYWDWAKADRHFERALELDANYETALRFYSFYLACMGRHEEALGFSERARDLDPVSPKAHQTLGEIHYFARRYDKAVTQFTETLDLAPDFGPAHVMLGRVYVAKGLPDRATEKLTRARGLLGSRPDVLTPYAYVLARAGRKREALETLAELRRISKPREPAPIRIAFVHIGLGETDRAFELLEKALEARDWQMALLKVEPAFDDLRSDPRFATLLERVGLPRESSDSRAPRREVMKTAKGRRVAMNAAHARVIARSGRRLAPLKSRKSSRHIRRSDTILAIMCSRLGKPLISKTERCPSG